MQVALVNASLALPGAEVVPGWLPPQHRISRDQVGSTCPRAWRLANPTNNKKRNTSKYEVETVALGNVSCTMRRDCLGR